MHRLLYYTVGSYLAPSKLLSSFLVGLTAADMAYIINTGYLCQPQLTAIVTSLVILKTTTGAAYAYKTIMG